MEKMKSRVRDGTGRLKERGGGERRGTGRLKERGKRGKHGSPEGEGGGERHGTVRLKERGAVKDTLPLNLAS